MVDDTGTSREQLLDAAARVFAERGYRGASVEAIAAAANVTKGALYWNFTSKADLFSALLDERVDGRLRLLVERTQPVDDERQTRLLVNEHWSLAARDREMAARWAERQRALRQLVAQTLTADRDATSPPLAHDPTELATAVLALANGLAMERIVDPDAVPDSLFADVLQLIRDGLAARAASTPTR